MLVLPPDANPAAVAEVDDLVAEHGRDRAALLPVLGELERRHGAVGDLAMQVVADRFGIPAVEVLGVVGFYSYLRGARGRHAVRVCRSLSCDLAGARAVGARLEEELGVPIGTTTADGAVTVEWVHCLGQCDRAPAMLVDDTPCGDLTPEGAAALVTAVRAGDDAIKADPRHRAEPP